MACSGFISCRRYAVAACRESHGQQHLIQGRVTVMASLVGAKTEADHQRQVQPLGLLLQIPDGQHTVILLKGRGIFLHKKIVPQIFFGRFQLYRHNPGARGGSGKAGCLVRRSGGNPRQGGAVAVFIVRGDKRKGIGGEERFVDL